MLSLCFAGGCGLKEESNRKTFLSSSTSCDEDIFIFSPNSAERKIIFYCFKVTVLPIFKITLKLRVGGQNCGRGCSFQVPCVGVFDHDRKKKSTMRNVAYFIQQASRSFIKRCIIKSGNSVPIFKSFVP